MTLGYAALAGTVGGQEDGGRPSAWTSALQFDTHTDRVARIAYDQAKVAHERQQTALQQAQSTHAHLRKSLLYHVMWTVSGPLATVCIWNMIASQHFPTLPGYETLWGAFVYPMIVVSAVGVLMWSAGTSLCDLLQFVQLRRYAKLEDESLQELENLKETRPEVSAVIQCYAAPRSEVSCSVCTSADKRRLRSRAALPHFDACTLCQTQAQQHATSPVFWRLVCSQLR